MRYLPWTWIIVIGLTSYDSHVYLQIRGLPYGSGLGLSRCLGPGECLHSFIQDVHNVIYKGQGINTDCYLPIKSCSEIDLTKLIASGSALFSRP